MAKSDIFLWVKSGLLQVISLRMIRKLQPAQDSFHLLAAPVHPDGKLRHLELHMGEADFEIAGASSDLADIRLQIGDIRLNGPQDLKEEFVRWFGHGLPQR